MKGKLTLDIEKGDNDNKPRASVSVTVDIDNGEGSHVAGSVPLTGKCSSYKLLESEILKTKEHLDTLLERAKQVYEAERGEEESLDITETMSAREIWDALSRTEDPEGLIAKFNSMTLEKRLEVADYVLANCNVFSGPASLFSIRYNSEEGLFE